MAKDPTPEAGSNRAARRARRSEERRGPRDGFTGDAATAAHRRSSSLGGPTAKHISAARSAAGRRNQARKDGR